MNTRSKYLQVSFYDKTHQLHPTCDIEFRQKGCISFQPRIRFLCFSADCI